MKRYGIVQHAFLFALLALPAVAAAAPSTFQELVGMIIDLANLTVPILIGLAVLLYFWNISKNLFGIDGSGGDQQQKMKEAILWGLGILFVMVSIWGILNILKNAVFQGGGF